MRYGRESLEFGVLFGIYSDRGNKVLYIKIPHISR